MNQNPNPYLNALDGLKINDPVKAFFDFCHEREKIRKNREIGLPFPWTDDKIFKKARFLNVFREDLAARYVYINEKKYRKHIKNWIMIG